MTVLPCGQAHFTHEILRSFRLLLCLANYLGVEIHPLPAFPSCAAHFTAFYVRTRLHGKSMLLSFFPILLIALLLTPSPPIRTGADRTNFFF